MGRRGPFWGFSLLIITPLLASACSVSEPPLAVPVVPRKGSVPARRANQLRSNLLDAKRRVREIEGRLAERDREMTAVRNEVEELRAREHATRAALDELKHAKSSVASTAVSGSGRAPSPAPAESASGATDDAPAAAARTGPERSGSGEDSAKLVASLRSRLEAERRQRRKLEGQLTQLQQETSAGPFENSLQTALQDARREITLLKKTLATERQARQALEQRYAALQQQVRASQEATADTSNAMQREEIEALKARQRRVLASIQRDLGASQQRERELRDAIALTQGPDGISLAEAVASVRTENSALQMRLNEEHTRNRELSVKLDLAMRVTDLIFKMQASASAPPPEQ